jgi:hypothetical protein
VALAQPDICQIDAAARMHSQRVEKAAHFKESPFQTRIAMGVLPFIQVSYLSLARPLPRRVCPNLSGFARELAFAAAANANAGAVVFQNVVGRPTGESFPIGFSIFCAQLRGAVARRFQHLSKTCLKASAFARSDRASLP